MKNYFKNIHQIDAYIHKTPIMTSRLLNEYVGGELYFKCENFQKAGAFKMRGAVNAILNLSKEQREKGVVTHSSGNFAQAVALAGKNLGIKTYIIMPRSAPMVKKEAVKAYGGILIECQSTLKAREITANQIVQEKGATFLHPSNDLDVIIGQGSAALELLTELPALEYIITPVGGGGLIAGTALATQLINSNCQVIGGEPMAVDDAYRSLNTRKIETNQNTKTIADGLKTQLGDINFLIILEYVKQIIRVEEDEIINAMRLIWERLKIIIEPSSAVAFAAILKEKQQFEGKKIGIILSGGNVDMSKIPF